MIKKVHPVRRCAICMDDFRPRQNAASYRTRHWCPACRRAFKEDSKWVEAKVRQVTCR